MLGLILNLMRPLKGAVLPGGILSDGDWIKMTDVNWNAVGATSATKWQDWDATDDD